MQRTIKHIFQNKVLLTDLTEQISQHGSYLLPFGNTERIILEEGVIYIKYFSNYLFYLELTNYELHADLDAGFINEKTRLFLFMMLHGNITFSTVEGLPITSVGKDTCYVTYNRKSEFLYKLPKGNHQFFYICPKTAWLKSNLLFDPRIRDFLDSMKTNSKLFDHMSSCTINNHLHELLLQLFTLKNYKQIEFESNLLNIITTIIIQYQILLDTKFSQRAYLIKAYIDANYFNEHVDIKALASHFNITEKTIIRIFKNEIGITPYRYLLKVRLENAKRLIVTENMLPSQVYQQVGYSDLQSFRRQFKHFFGIPPSKAS
ncbi:AraC family transcriptional regulator [Sphingobacterium sp. ML3W]|uniref:helix-turn-helix domain-containing protein n=1 Tax=Sphingobacterium sp. ML3W TaxID=1538644 RepID=UPI00249B490E|nr:AraC family transcriptional regulator [Sphingobacterium sp. ML3W]WFA81372.1 AraC family transcriptional regulator [Sphingobacterium sp. ML3W]